MSATATSQQRRLELNRRVETMLSGPSTGPYSAEDIALIRQYSGYGGIVDASTIGTPQMTEYYTDSKLVRKMWALTQAYFEGPVTSVCEPACGSGRFFDYLPASAARVVGLDISPGAVKVARALYGNRLGLEIREQPFEGMFFDKQRSIAAQRISEARKGQGFDVVIGNPPYGTFQSFHAGLGERDATGAQSWDEYFVTRGVDLLNPGGVLCYVVGGSVEAGSTLFLDRKFRKNYHEPLFAKAQLLDAYRLPQGIFLDTDVSTEILVFQKRG